MTAAQNAAFSAGAGVTPSTLLVAIAGVSLTLTFIWAIWLTVGTFSAWQAGRASLFDLTWTVCAPASCSSSSVFIFGDR